MLKPVYSSSSRQALTAGFGTLLVDTSARQLGASVSREIADDHYRLVLSLPRAVTVDG